jgi:hypothetical protein
MTKLTEMTKEEFCAAWEEATTRDPDGSYQFVCGTQDGPNTAENAWASFRSSAEVPVWVWADSPEVAAEWFAGLATYLGTTL